MSDKKSKPPDNGISSLGGLLIVDGSRVYVSNSFEQLVSNLSSNYHLLRCTLDMIDNLNALPNYNLWLRTGRIEPSFQHIVRTPDELATENLIGRILESWKRAFVRKHVGRFARKVEVENFKSYYEVYERMRKTELSLEEIEEISRAFKQLPGHFKDNMRGLYIQYFRKVTPKRKCAYWTNYDKIKAAEERNEASYKLFCDKSYRILASAWLNVLNSPDLQKKFPQRSISEANSSVHKLLKLFIKKGAREFAQIAIGLDSKNLNEYVDWNDIAAADDAIYGPPTFVPYWQPQISNRDDQCQGTSADYPK